MIEPSTQANGKLRSWPCCLWGLVSWGKGLKLLRICLTLSLVGALRPRVNILRQGGSPPCPRYKMAVLVAASSWVWWVGGATLWRRKCVEEMCRGTGGLSNVKASPCEHVCIRTHMCKCVCVCGVSPALSEAQAEDGRRVVISVFRVSVGLAVLASHQPRLHVTSHPLQWLPGQYLWLHPSPVLDPRFLPCLNSFIL